MTFKEFSEYLAKIDATASRNEMTVLLADLLKEVDKEEVEKAVYLALGGIAPMYKAINFNLADKLMVRAIARAFGKTAEEIQKNYKKTGDLGEVALSLRTETSRHLFEPERLRAEWPERSEGSSPDSNRDDTNIPIGASRLDSSPSLRMTVSKVFDCLTEIALESGLDSQERKLTETAELLKKLDPLGTKYAVRIILGKLRLGFSDKTILDALSFMVSGDKSARAKLEGAYNVRPDVGWIASQISNFKFQISNLRAEPVAGTPVIPALCQRLPTTEEIIKKMSKVIVEPKFDGQRVQAHVSVIARKINLFTRSLEDVTPMFPDLTDALSVILSERQRVEGSLILDGEVVAIDPKTGKISSFQTMITRKRKYGVAENLLKVPIRYMVFDILEMNGESLLNEPFYKRREVLEDLFRHPEESATKDPANEESDINIGRDGLDCHGPSGLAMTEKTPQNDERPFNAISLAPQIVTSDPTEVREYLKQQINRGLEGIVAKKWDSPYSPGRTGFHWVKLKWEGEAKSGGLLDTVDGVVMGIYKGKGKRSGFGAGAFLAGILSNPSNSSNPSYKTISKIGTGLSDEQWKQLKIKSEKLASIRIGRSGLRVKEKPKEYDVPKNLIPDIWMKPELVAEIQADNITKSPLHTAGYALRFPRLVRYRSDKRAEQATTKEEIEKLYEMQSS